MTAAAANAERITISPQSSAADWGDDNAEAKGRKSTKTGRRLPIEGGAARIFFLTIRIHCDIRKHNSAIRIDASQDCPRCRRGQHPFRVNFAMSGLRQLMIASE